MTDVFPARDNVESFFSAMIAGGFSHNPKSSVHAITALLKSHDVAIKW